MNDIIGTRAPASLWLDGVNYQTGRANTSHEGMVESVEFIRRLAADQVIQPGWESWTQQRAFTEFARGSIGMYVGAAWHINEINALNADIDFGVVAFPAPASGRTAYTGLASSFTPIWSMSSESEHPEEAWQLMDFLVSEDFQRAYFEKFRSFTAVESAWREADLSEQEDGIRVAQDESMRRSPSARVNGPGPQALAAAISGNPDIKPGAKVIEAITRNEDFAPKAAQLDAQIEAFIDAQIAEISAGGQDVSWEDLTFSDYDPMTDWTPPRS